MAGDKSEEQTQAWVTDVQLAEGMRFTFIRLVPRGTVSPAASYSVEYADVDLDAEGNVIGITIPSWAT